MTNNNLLLWQLFSFHHRLGCLNLMQFVENMVYIYIFLFKYLNQSLKFYFSSWQNKIPITFCYQIVCWFFFEGNQLCCVWKLFWIVWILKYRSWDRSSKGYVWYHQWDWCWNSEIANPKTIKGSIQCIEQRFDSVWVRELIVDTWI